MATFKPPPRVPPHGETLAHVPKKWKEAARVHDARIDADEAHVRHTGRDAVEQAGIDSFPASDPPSKTVTRGEKTD